MRSAARSITSEDAEQKSSLRGGLGINFDSDAAYMKATRERLSTARPQHLNEATTAIKNLIRSQSFEGAWALYTQVENPDSVVLSLGLHLCAKARWFERAVQIWDSMSDHTIVSFSAMIDVCGRCKQLEFAEDVFEMLKASQVKMNMIPFNSMVNAYAMCGQPQKALLLFQSIPEELVKQASLRTKRSGFNSVMIALARSGDYAQTRALFEQMTNSGIQPDNGHFSALLTACVSDCHTEVAQGCFDIITEYGLKPDITNWTCLLSCHRYDLARCLSIIEEMGSAGIKPSPLTYQELLEAHVLANDGPGARRLLASEAGNIYDSSKSRRLTAQAHSMP